jgi:1,4-dihydroxy-2-naphthoyl-CoA synthase
MNETKTQVGQIRTEVHGHVFKIIIDNVAKKNSFSPQMMAQMSDAMTLLDRTDDYWVGVLCAEARISRPGWICRNSSDPRPRIPRSSPATSMPSR